MRRETGQGRRAMQDQVTRCSLCLGLEGQDGALGRQWEPCELSQQEMHLPSGCRSPSPPDPSGSPFRPSSSSLDQEGPKGVQHVGRWLTPLFPCPKGAIFLYRLPEVSYPYRRVF